MAVGELCDLTSGLFRLHAGRGVAVVGLEVDIAVVNLVHDLLFQGYILTKQKVVIQLLRRLVDAAQAKFGVEHWARRLLLDNLFRRVGGHRGELAFRWAGLVLLYGLFNFLELVLELHQLLLDFGVLPQLCLLFALVVELDHVLDLLSFADHVAHVGVVLLVREELGLLDALYATRFQILLNRVIPLTLVDGIHLLPLDVFLYVFSLLHCVLY